MSNISFTPVKSSRLNEIDFDNLKFGNVVADYMFMADYYDGEWHDMRIVPYQNMSVSPANMAWHYGQAIFEGMKATKAIDGTPYLYRPEDHAKRLNFSANRMDMPSFPEDMFLEALHMLTDINKDWIPVKEGSALYIRPFMIAFDNNIGVRPSYTYRFMILNLPSNAYYTKKLKLKVEEKYVRATIGGVGNVKNAGNYGAAMYPTSQAQKEGFDQVLWLDGIEKKYIQEVGTMNIFFVIDGTIVTPAIDGAILNGITRKSIIKILKDKNYPVVEKALTIDEVIKAYKDGKLTEIFGAGTAAVVAKVSSINYKGINMELPSHEMSILIKQEVDGIRNTTLEDKWGWMVKVNPKEKLV